MIKALIFDLDDTLYEYERINLEAISALCSYTCNLLHISTDSFQNAFQWARNETKKTLGDVAASHNRLLYCQKTLEFLGMMSLESAFDMYEVYWGYILAHMQLRDGVLELFEYCRMKHIKIGICTDLTAHIQYRKLKTLGITQWIDAIITSEEAGKEKPAAIMFEMILKKLNVLPEQAVFIGDSLKKDIQGAQENGIRALWLSSEADAMYETISSLKEVQESIASGK